MEKRQLVLLFGCSLIPWTIGNGIMPLLPVYAGKLGASSAESGAYLAIAYVAITLGALSASWISGRFGRKGPLAAVGLLAVPLTWLTGQVTNLWQLTAVTAALWLLGGMGFALTSILAGLCARPEERGRVFGVLSMSGPVGALIGGLAAGPLVDGWGFAAMFLAFALAALAWPVMALLVKDMRIDRPGSEKRASSEPPPALGGMFWLLFTASLVVMVANMAGVLGRSLVMDNLGFSAAAISGTGAVEIIGAGTNANATRVVAINGTNSYTGGTNVLVGTLRLGASGALPNAAVTVSGALLKSRVSFSGPT
mgnify:CR=1 FL=1